MSETHPMHLKARREFEQALASGKPLRWIMLNRPKVRGVANAEKQIRNLCERYPDIAEKYDAENVLHDELVYERQYVLTRKTQKAAIKTLSEWYNRTQQRMAYRYTQIVNEAKKMPEYVLEAERKEFVSQESKAEIETEAPAIADNDKKTIELNDYPQLIIANCEKRMDELLKKQELLLAEMNGKSGQIKDLNQKLDEVNEKIKAIEIVKAMNLEKEEE
jgi:hypothetical protein